MPKTFSELHAEESELVRRERLGKNVGGRLAEVRRQMMQHHDRLFEVDTSDEAVSRRLGLSYVAPSRPGPGFDGDDGR